MEEVILYIAREWARSGNPAWLKAAMLVLAVVLPVVLVRSIVLFLLECRRLEREEELRR